jgi:hypothetical protein
VIYVKTGTFQSLLLCIRLDRINLQGTNTLAYFGMKEMCYFQTWSTGVEEHLRHHRQQQDLRRRLLHPLPQQG